MTFRDADVREVIDSVSRVSGASIILAPEVKGTVTLSFNNVPWEDALGAVLKTLGYTLLRREGNILVADP